MLGCEKMMRPYKSFALSLEPVKETSPHFFIIVSAFIILTSLFKIAGSFVNTVGIISLKHKKFGKFIEEFDIFIPH